MRGFLNEQGVHDFFSGINIKTFIRSFWELEIMLFFRKYKGLGSTRRLLRRFVLQWYYKIGMVIPPSEIPCMIMQT